MRIINNFICTLWRIKVYLFLDFSLWNCIVVSCRHLIGKDILTIVYFISKWFKLYIYKYILLMINRWHNQIYKIFINSYRAYRAIELLWLFKHFKHVLVMTMTWMSNDEAKTISLLMFGILWRNFRIWAINICKQYNKQCDGSWWVILTYYGKNLSLKSQAWE